MNALGTSLLCLSTLFFAFTTILSAWRPAAFAERLGLAVASAGGANEIRSQYAGFFLAAAIACVAALRGAVSRPTAFLLLAVIFGGLAVGRLTSVALNRGIAGFGSTIVGLLFIDCAGFALAVAALLGERAA